MFSIFGAVVGWSIYRFPGAIAGYFLGSFIDQYNGKRKNSGGQRDVFRDLFDQQRGKTVNPQILKLTFYPWHHLLSKQMAP